MTADAPTARARVRCLDCAHADRSKARCPIDGRPIKSPGAWRRCDAFAPDASPAERAREALRAAGLLGHVAALADMDGRRVGLCVRAEADRKTASRVLLTVDRAMRRAA
ncbi:hypothetical protein [uncultured Thiohalocapsa sp.]|uniref:hypothetical protein n=1 Tax=uncultured Thiohalocapsa sp. TaxID=768990 RepID=UPI0025F355F1|nr:hypothetical protein [uncultured Thiohalocapsa sp.]